MPTKIGKILIRSVEILIRSILYLFGFLFTWAAFYLASSFLAIAFSPLIGIYGDDRYTLALRASFLIACYSFWVLFRPVKTSAQLKADREKWNMREYMREFKRGQRQAAWAKRSKLYRFMTSGGAFLIFLGLVVLWFLFSLLI